MMDANARRGKRVEGENLEDEKVLGPSGRHELNDNRKRLPRDRHQTRHHQYQAHAIEEFPYEQRHTHNTHNAPKGERPQACRLPVTVTRKAHRRRVRNMVDFPQRTRPPHRIPITIW